MSNNKIVVPKQYNIMMPYLVVADVRRAIAFYARAFGCHSGEMPVDDSGQVSHGEFSYHGQVFMCAPQGDGPIKTPRASGVPSPLSLYLYCADVDTFYAQATGAGAKSISAPQDMYWGDRMCRLEDEDGYVWGFATAHAGVH